MYVCNPPVCVCGCGCALCVHTCVFAGTHVRSMKGGTPFSVKLHVILTSIPTHLHTFTHPYSPMHTLTHLLTHLYPLTCTHSHSLLKDHYFIRAEKVEIKPKEETDKMPKGEKSHAEKSKGGKQGSKGKEDQTTLDSPRASKSKDQTTDSPRTSKEVLKFVLVLSTFFLGHQYH